jgi:hypothetical protein
MSFVSFPNFKPAIHKFIAESCCLDGKIKFIPAINGHQSQ